MNKVRRIEPPRIEIHVCPSCGCRDIVISNGAVRCQRCMRAYTHVLPKMPTLQPRIDMSTTCTMCPACGGRDVVISNGTMACVRCSRVTKFGAVSPMIKREPRKAR